jgi:RNA polymerase sigma factor (sigma-70 family)
MTTINFLITSHLGLAERIAALKKKKLYSVHQEELLSAAYLGLVEAAHKFEESKCTSFPVFASFRIAGAIKDYLREMSWGTRHNPVRRTQMTEDMLTDCMDDPCELIAKLTKCLGERERQIVRLHYQAGMEQAQIAQEVGLSKSRICQILQSAVETMRSVWEDSKAELYEQVA